MAHLFKHGLVLGNAQTAGVQAFNSFGAYITTGGAAYTKGAWTELVAATTVDTTWMQVKLSTAFASSLYSALDIAQGAAGVETVIINNLSMSMLTGFMNSFFFPINIRAGTRLSARTSSDYASGGDNISVQITLFDSGVVTPGSNGGIDTYGFSTSSNTGVRLDPGAVQDTKGSYTQITASLTNDIRGFFLGFDTQRASTGSVGNILWLYDLAVGSAGSEKIILPDQMQHGIEYASYSQLSMGVTPFYPVPVALGNRVAIRAQCHTTTTPDRYLGVTLYGIR